MKKMTYIKIIFAIPLLFFISCSTNKNKTNEVVDDVVFKKVNVNKIDNILEEKSPYFTCGKNFYTPEYINYDEITSKDKKSIKKTDRYSDVSSDGEINWIENKEYKNILSSEILKKITLNAQNIDLPASFSNIDENLSSFDKIDLKQLYKKVPVHFKDLKNDYYLEIFFNPKEEKEFQKSGILKYESIVSKDNKNLFNTTIQELGNQTMISGIETNIYKPYGHQYKLQVNGIGIGNTFNEMYDILGIPYGVYIDENLKSVLYICFDEKSNKTYSIRFEYMKSVKDSSNNIFYVNNNLITSIIINVE